MAGVSRGMSALSAVGFALVLAMCAGQAAALKFDLKVGATRCFADTLSKDALVKLKYDIVGAPPSSSGFTVRVETPKQDSSLYKRRDATTDVFGFSAPEDGRYEFCVTNQGNALRRVNMDILTGVNAEDYSEVAKKEHLEPIEVELRKLEDQVFEVHKEFLYMREREAAMRDTNESTNARVMWYSIFSIVGLLSLSGWQVYYLRRFFRKNKIAQD